MTQFKLFACSVFALLCMSVPATAHHGTGINYDTSIKYTLSAVVTRFRYAQPHLQIFLDMNADPTNPESEAANWACEYVPNIPFLIRQGFTKKIMKADLPKGAEISVVMTPARSGDSVCLVHKMMTSEGKVIGPDLEALMMPGSKK